MNFLNFRCKKYLFRCNHKFFIYISGIYGQPYYPKMSQQSWVNDPLLTVTRSQLVCPNSNCNKVFKNEKSRNCHMQQVCNQPLRYKCSYCDHKSHYSKDIRRHIGIRHIGLPQNVIELFDPHFKTRLFICPNNNCSKRYKHSQNLTRHLEYECGKSPRFKCFYCDFKNCFKDRVQSHCKEKHPDKQFFYENVKDNF